MGHPPKQLIIGIPSPSFDGKYYGRYPLGNKPQGAVLAANAAESVSAVSALSTAIKLGGMAAAQASAAAALTAAAGGSTIRSNLAFYIDADNGGAFPQSGDPGWNGAAISTDRAYSGTKSYKFPIIAGSTGQGFWWPISEMLGGHYPTKGAMLSFSFRIWVPASGVNWDGGGAEHGIKWLRYRMGVIGDQIWNDSKGTVYTKLAQDGSVYINREGFAGSLPTYQTMSAPGTANPINGQWTTLEHLVVFSDVAVDSGGIAEQRYYRDGVQVFRDTARPTLQAATDIVHSLAWIDYWNNAAPATFDAYLDQISLAVYEPGFRDDRPNMSLDAGGRYFQGV